MTIDLPTIWAGIIGLGVFLYLLLDGFDLGIGLLFPFFDREGEREVMLNTVAPVWDGNETWLVFSMTSRSPSRSKNGNRRPMPRSKPSSST